jgi:hypothetical protein
MKRIVMGLAGLLVVVGLVIGGMKIMQQVQYNEMVNTVKSEEV